MIRSMTDTPWPGDACSLVDAFRRHERSPLEELDATLAAISDGGYAILAGRAGQLLSRQRVLLVSRISGLCLIGGGAWLALARAR